MSDDDSLLMPSPESCLAATRYIESTHPAIVDLVERLRVRELAHFARAATLFRFVRDEIRYEFMAKLTPEEYLASQVLQEAKGFCVQKAVLLCALSRAAEVPCAIVLSDLLDQSLSPKIARALGTNVMFHHGLNAFYLEGRWLEVDASLSPDVTTRKGYRVVDFDGTREALLPETTLAGGPHATYARFHGTYAELPSTRCLVRVLKALADQRRFKMVQDIAAAGELSCGQVGERFDLTQPAISHHLKILAAAEVLLVRRVGQHALISVNRALLDDVAAVLPRRLRSRPRSAAARVARREHQP